MEESFEDFIRNNPDVTVDEAFEKFKCLNPQFTEKKQLRDEFFKAVETFYKENPDV